MSERLSHSAIGRIRAGRFPAAHGGATLPCQTGDAAQETVKSTASVISLVPPALIRQGAAVALALMLAGPVFAQVECRFDPDSVTIRDDGPGRAIVTYRNSAAGCSEGESRILTSAAGIKVRVVIDVNVDDEAELERIDVFPQDRSMLAFPPRDEIRDGETTEIVVQGGMA